MVSRVEQICLEKGLKITEQRRIIARVVSESLDHPDVDKIYKKASAIDENISIATVYRTMKLFEESGVVEKHDFGIGRARYEVSDEGSHHDHLIDIVTGEVLEFYNKELEAMKKKVAQELGYELIDHRLELYARPIKAIRDAKN